MNNFNYVIETRWAQIKRAISYYPYKHNTYPKLIRDGPLVNDGTNNQTTIIIKIITKPLQPWKPPYERVGAIIVVAKVMYSETSRFKWNGDKKMMRIEGGEASKG